MNQKSSKSLLERLYRGEIFPAEDIVPRSKTYRDAEDEQNRCHDQLEEKLSEELVELLEEYKAASEDTHRVHLEHTFAAGVSFGVRLMLEALREDEVEMK